MNHSRSTAGVSGRRVRRPRRVAVLGLALTAGVLVAGVVPGDAATQASGLAKGQVIRVVPFIGLGGVDVAVGVAQSEVTGAAAKSSAGAASLGILPMLLGSVESQLPVPVDVPDLISADSSGTQHVVQEPIGAIPWPSGTISVASERADAVEQLATARSIGVNVDVAGVLALAGAHVDTRSDAGKASSVVAIPRLVLGPLTLRGLTWSAEQAMGQVGKARFTVDAATLAGIPIPLEGKGLGDLLASVNKATEPLGLRVQVPATVADKAGAAVGPLSIEVRNPETLAKLLGDTVKALDPLLKPALDQVVAATNTGTAGQLLVNAVRSTITGRGGLRLELGGASARLGQVEVANADYGNPAESFDVGPVSIQTGDTGGTPSTTADLGPASSTSAGAPVEVAAPPTRTPNPEAVIRPARVLKPARNMVVPFLLALVLTVLVALAIGDRNRLRRFQTENEL